MNCVTSLDHENLAAVLGGVEYTGLWLAAVLGGVQIRGSWLVSRRPGRGAQILACHVHVMSEVHRFGVVHCPGLRLRCAFTIVSSRVIVPAAPTVALAPRAFGL